MSGTAQGHRYKYAVAKQSAEGTPATTAAFSIPVFGGAISPVEDRAQYEVTSDAAFRPGAFKSQARVEGAPQFACFPDSLGLLIAGHLGTDTKTGSEDPWNHEITRSDTHRWHTFWGKRPLPAGGAQWEKFTDVLIKALEFQWAAGAPLRVVPTLLGKAALGDVAAPTITTENKMSSGEEKFTANGSVLKLEIDDTPAATRVRNIQGFTFRMGYEDLTLEQTDDFHPDIVDSGLWTVGLSMDVILQDLAAYNAAFYGAADPSTGAAQSELVLAGSIDFTIPVGPMVNADHFLQIEAPALEFTVTPPEPDVSGRGVRATVTAALQEPASGEPVTVTVSNAVTAAY